MIAEHLKETVKSLYWVLNTCAWGFITVVMAALFLQGEQATGQRLMESPLGLPSLVAVIAFLFVSAFVGNVRRMLRRF